MPIVVGILIALLVAGGVLLLASAASGARDRQESPWRAFRRGLTGRKHPDAEQRAAAAAAAAQPVDLSLADFLSATAEEGEPYLDVDALTTTLHDARSRAADALPGSRRA